MPYEFFVNTDEIDAASCEKLETTGIKVVKFTKKDFTSYNGVFMYMLKNENVIPILLGFGTYKLPDKYTPVYADSYDDLKDLIKELVLPETIKRRNKLVSELNQAYSEEDALMKIVA